MTIQKIRDEMTDRLGQVLNFKFNGARNQIEEFSGEVINTYPAVFLIRIQDDNHLVKSFSYSDILTESLEIIDQKSK